MDMEDEAEGYTQKICGLFEESADFGSFEEKLIQGGIPEKDALAAVFGLAKTDERFIDKFLQSQH